MVQVIVQHDRYYKIMMTDIPSEMPKLTVITVVFNSEKHIERTMLSVINQSYKNIEYILIDGKSKDQTVHRIKNYEDKIAAWISEKDLGIYDAMNKGLAIATGDYVLFLNSGDELFSSQTIENVFHKKKNWADVYYGETEIFNEDWKRMGDRRLKAPAALNWKSLKNGMVVCHQSFIVKRNLAPLYNLKYKLAADIDWMINCLRKSETVENANMRISKFMAGGKSRQNTVKSLKERFGIMVENYGLVMVLYSHVAITFRFLAFVIAHRKIN
jgi:glycosyltransferase involved in cell wall biosynthesis